MRPSRMVARALKLVFKGTVKEYPWLVEGLNEVLPEIPGNLKTKAITAVIQGDAHVTQKRDGTVDPLHVSGAILNSKGGHLTSFHAYPNGRIVFSKKKYGEATFTSQGNSQADASSLASESSQTQAFQGYDSPSRGFATGLTWTMDSGGQTALYWDGQSWKPGQWSEEHGLWVAYHGEIWYAWQ